MEAGTRQKHFVSGVRYLKRQVNRLPDGFMAPTMSSGRMFPIIVTGEFDSANTEISLLLLLHGFVSVSLHLKNLEFVMILIKMYLAEGMQAAIVFL